MLALGTMSRPCDLVTAITEQARQGTGEESAHFQGILRAELRLLTHQLAQMEERIKRLEGQLDMAGCANPSSSLKRFSDYLDMKDNKLKAEIGAIRWVLSKWTLEFERNRDTLRLQQLQVEEEHEVDDYLQRIEGFLKAYSARLRMIPHLVAQMEQLEQKDLGRNSRCSLVSVGELNSGHSWRIFGSP